MTGTEVRDLRKRLGQNQNEFWSRVRVTQSGGSRYESGGFIPEPVKLLLELVYGPEESALAMLQGLRQNTPTNSPTEIPQVNLSTSD